MGCDTAPHTGEDQAHGAVFRTGPKGVSLLDYRQEENLCKEEQHKGEGSFSPLMAHWGNLSHFLSLPSHHPVENLIACESLGPKVG